MNVLPYLLIIATGILSGYIFLGGRSVMMVIIAATASLSTAQTYALFFVWMKQYESAVMVAALLVLSNLLGGGIQIVKRRHRENSEESH